MTAHQGVSDIDLADPDLQVLPRTAPPRLAIEGGSPPPRLLIRRRGIPLATKLFALFVLLVVFWVVGHVLLSSLVTVQASAPITQTATTPTTQFNSPAHQTSYPTLGGARHE
jgi:hypothetical protein